MFTNGGDGGRAAAHAVVQHRVALVGVGTNKVLNKVGWLLCGMDTLVVHRLATLIIEELNHAGVVCHFPHNGILIRWATAYGAAELVA